jgi:hypothetical protein
MYLTEELLTEWTGLKGRELSIFYLMYKKHAPNALLHNDLEYTKQDILKFKNSLSNKRKGDEITYKNVKSLIKFWESKVVR